MHCFPLRIGFWDSDRHIEHSGNHRQIIRRVGKWRSSSHSQHGLTDDHKSVRWQAPLWTAEAVVTPYGSNISAACLKKWKGRSTSWLALNPFSVVFWELNKIGRQSFKTGTILSLLIPLEEGVRWGCEDTMGRRTAAGLMCPAELLKLAQLQDLCKSW